MRSSNPVMNSLSSAKGGAQRGAFEVGGPQGYQDPYAGYGQAPAQATGERPMTVDDVVSKTGMTLGVIVLFAVVNFGISLVSPGLAVLLTIAGAIGGLVTVLIATFGKKYGSAAVTLIYAAFEGLFVGGISLLFSGMLFGDANGGVLIGQAVLGTLGVFLGMLFVYKTGAVKVTPKFNRILTGAIVGVLVLAVGNLLLALITGANPLRDGGMLAIIFSLVCIGLAAMSFLSDFDAADKMIRAGAPSKMAWGVALGLAVTLVWLYTEILRLLSYFRSN
ncbi:Bax inhibitor-1/YccA family protein [Corynebacterium suedekumii]|uniref:Bax inhibitor-1/YccA family protein n=1 Tax=Corynebacterium suedekumii TaxID=3049801 RepID=A0ABY8VKW5_9CORY|nr:Bax inhibitor-1/YccA family protein [Corynebacterium suedekumii]WIM69308.1 Bax inhibitor-1/YccA family protein [Corynebacterium suedekumii]